jgi:hypothetical protein
MAETTGLFPYDIDELTAGPIRCLWAPISQAIPTTLADVIDQVSPYAPKTGWVDFGATAGPWVNQRNITTTQFKIQQTTLTVQERVNEVVRTVQVAVAELRPDVMQVLEGGPTTETAVAGTGVGAYTKAPFGNILDLTQYRMAFIGCRGKDQGIVTEPTTSLVRGRMFAYFANRVQLAAENLQTSLGQGDLGNANCTFKLYPDYTEAAGAEHGAWVFEDAGTFT